MPINLVPVCLYTNLSDRRVRCEIEQTLKRRTSTPHIKHNRSKVEGRKRQIQATSDALEARNSPAPSVSKRVASSTPVGPRRTATVSMSGSGTFLALHSQTLCGIPIIPYFSTDPR